jgi:hypothetical protein
MTSTHDEPTRGARALARQVAAGDKVARVASHYGLPPEHAEALCTPHADRAVRARLAADVASYMAAGGAIHAVPDGMSGLDERADGVANDPWREFHI